MNAYLAFPRFSNASFDLEVDSLILNQESKRLEQKINQLVKDREDFCANRRLYKASKAFTAVALISMVALPAYYLGTALAVSHVFLKLIVGLTVFSSIPDRSFPGFLIFSAIVDTQTKLQKKIDQSTTKMEELKQRSIELEKQIIQLKINEISENLEELEQNPGFYRTSKIIHILATMTFFSGCVYGAALLISSHAELVGCAFAASLLIKSVLPGNSIFTAITDTKEILQQRLQEQRTLSTPSDHQSPEGPQE